MHTLPAMASDIDRPMEGIKMYFEKNCYFCRNLCFFDVENVNEFYCTLTGLPYKKTKLNIECEDFVPDMEE